MCGVCGIYGSPEDNVKVVEMMATLQHRGPDDRGMMNAPHCALGHQRLSILDLSPNGRQPMSNENNTIWLVVNGEVYNYRDLRSKLRDKGHLFRSESDSEVIIHCYEEYGDAFVDKLRGMFALAIYDKNVNKLILARDPIGKKPLYYYKNGQNIVFGSEIKALFKAGVPCEVNYDMIPTYLMYQYTMGTDTLFKGVKKLSAGHTLIAKGGQVKIERYWQIKESFNGNGDDLRGLLEQSVKLRLQSDVPIGAFLSGGIDSSAVCALWRQQSAGQIHAFTATFGAHSEARWARIVSDYLSLTYHEVDVTPRMVARDIEKITWHHDEPLGDAATINNYYLSEEAKKYVTVVLAGEGGDEVFGGYPWYKYAGFIDKAMQVPWVLRAFGNIVTYVFGQGDVTARTYRLGRMSQFPCQLSRNEMLLYPTSAMNMWSVEWLLERFAFYEMKFAEPITSECVSNPYNESLAMDCLNKLPEQYLMKADKATMSHSIEERLPLLDKEIIEYAFTLPVSLKKDKYVLRKAVQDLLPQEIVWRPKKGFGTPLIEWLQDDDLRDCVIDAFTNGKLLREICKKDSLDKLGRLVFERALKPTGMMALSPANVVWSLFALQIWADIWWPT